MSYFGKTSMNISITSKHKIAGGDILNKSYLKFFYKILSITKKYIIYGSWDLFYLFQFCRNWNSNYENIIRKWFHRIW